MTSLRQGLFQPAQRRGRDAEIDQGRIVEGEYAVDDMLFLGIAPEIGKVLAEIGMGVEQRIGRCWAAGTKVSRQRRMPASTRRSSGRRAGSVIRPGRDDQQIVENVHAVAGVVTTTPSSRVRHRQPWRAEVQMKARQGAGAFEGIVGRRLVMAEEGGHDGVFVGVAEDGEAVDDPRRFHVPDVIDARQCLAPHEDVDFRNAGLQSVLGIVEARGAAAQYADTLAGQAREVDRLRGMGIQRARQGLRDHRRHVPLAAALDAGRQHHLARQELIAAVTDEAGKARRRARPAAAAYRCGTGKAQDVAEPAQIVHPVAARHLVDGVPACGAMLCFPPGPVGQGRHAEVDPRQMLRRAQGDHAGIGFPRPLVACRVFVDHQDIGHPFTHQAEGGAEAGLAAADDDDVIDMAVGMGCGPEPRSPRHGPAGRDRP